MLFEVSCIPYSWVGRWTVSCHSASQPGSGIASLPPAEPGCSSPWGIPYIPHCHHPEDMPNWHSIDTENSTETHTQSAVLSFLPVCWKGTGKKNTNLVASPPQSLQSCCLVAEFHLICLPTALCENAYHTCVKSSQLSSQLPMKWIWDEDLLGKSPFFRLCYFPASYFFILELC